MHSTTLHAPLEDEWSKEQTLKFWDEITSLRVEPSSQLSLADRATAYTGDLISKKESKRALSWGKEHMSDLQETLYADNRHSLLIILQAMDTAGKDGAIKHIMRGINPQGVNVTSFKHPSTEELDHDFLWRHYKSLPARGQIGIHNRSHYENVLVSRVHPEILHSEGLPHVRPSDTVDADFWLRRFETINEFEHIASKSGTVILKFFLHLSKEEQRQRLLARIDDEEKNWKFSLGDVRERGYWDEYQFAYEQAISATSQSHAPWFVIPADNKWYARLSIASVILHHMRKLNLSYPTVSAAQRENLSNARKSLIDEQR